METLRNEIVAVKELKNSFVSAKVNILQFKDKAGFSIQKTVVSKLGFTKVIGLKIEDVKNPRFGQYGELEYRTETTWLYE